MGCELEKIQDLLNRVMGVSSTKLIAANSVCASVAPDQVKHLATQKKIEFLELDPLVQLTYMDDVAEDIDLETYRNGHNSSGGAGVRVAVLDSGIDEKHPALNVVDRISTCGEVTDMPGSHGTHCAGSIASRDSVYGGVAPDVELLNIKVLRANGTGRHTYITQGIDEALDLNANVLSMSVGFNHLPTWSSGGHGWTCPDAQCPLCTAVDNAVSFGAVVVVAAGNEHDRANALRQFGFGNAFDTELGCPGQARGAITVGAVSKRTLLPASFSSRGPSVDNRRKPDLSAPGVNTWSTVPVPRDATGTLVPNPSRSELFAKKSGTSMATPVVAGAAALVIQQLKQASQTWTPDDVRKKLLNQGVIKATPPNNSIGRGTLILTNL